jgi:hypothetical protein
MQSRHLAKEHKNKQQTQTHLERAHFVKLGHKNYDLSYVKSL